MTHRLVEAMARLDALVREQLDWLEITTATPLPTITCHPHPYCGEAFGGPLAAVPDVADQVTELHESGLLGTVAVEVTGEVQRVRLWATPRERRMWEARIDLARQDPAAAELLRQGSVFKLATWRRHQAAKSIHEAVWAAEARMPTTPTNNLIALSQVSRASFYKWSKDRPEDYTPPALATPTPAAPAASSPTAVPPAGTVPASIPMDAQVASSTTVQDTPAKGTPGAAAGEQGIGAPGVAAVDAPAMAEVAQAEVPVDEVPAAGPVSVQAPASAVETPALPATGRVQASAAGARAGQGSAGVVSGRVVGDRSQRVGVQAPAARFSGPAVVLDVDVVGLPDGSEVALPFSVRHWGDVARMATHFQTGWDAGKGFVEIGQVWVMPAMLEQLVVHLDDLPPLHRRDAMERLRELTASTPAVQEAAAQGWEVGSGNTPALGRWTRLSRDGVKVRIALVAAMDAKAYPVLAGDPAPGVIARRLAMFASSYGFPVKLSPQTTMFDFVSLLRGDDRQRMFAASNNWLEIGPGVEEEMQWSRTPTDEELALPYLHGYDRGGSYLSGISGGFHFGIGEPEYRAGELEIGRNTFALCQIEPDTEPLTWAAPNPLLPNPHHRDGAQVWRTAATIAYARELGYQPRIIESWVWRETAPIYQPWYDHVVACRTQMINGATPDHDAVLAQLKAVYTRGIGQMGSDESQGQRHFHPERRWAILARARNNLLRKVMKIGNSTGVWPLAWDNDTIVYASAEPDPIKAWPGDPADLGRSVGKLRWEGSTMLNDHLAWLSGEGWTGKQELTKDWHPTGWELATSESAAQDPALLQGGE